MSEASSSAYIVLEPDASGHRFFYVELLFRAARAAGCPMMLVTTRDAVRSVEYAVHLEPLLDSDDVSLVEGGDGGSAIGRFRIRNQVLRHAERLCAEYPDAQVVIPELVHFLMPWTLRRDRKHLARRSTALLMRPAPTSSTTFRYLVRRQYSARQASAALVRGLILNRLRRHGLTVFDVVSAFGDAGGGIGATPTIMDSIAVNGHLPDPAAAAAAGPPCSRTQSRSALGLPVNESLVVVAGGIDRRKGIDVILDAFAIMSHSASCPLLVVAGRVEAEFLQDRRLRDLLSAGRLWIRNEYVTASDFRSFLCAADLMVVIRDRHEELSGVLAQAAICGRVVVTTGPSLIADTVARHRLGVVAATSPEAVAAAIEGALLDRDRLEEAVKPAQQTQMDIARQFTRALLGEACSGR